MTTPEEDINFDAAKNSLNYEDGASLAEVVTQFTESKIENGSARRYEEERLKSKMEHREPPPQPIKYPFFSAQNKPMRSKMMKIIPTIMLIFTVFILSVWSIYWGAMYNRQDRYVNMKVLVALEEDASGFVSQALIDTTRDPELETLATWELNGFTGGEAVKKSVYDEDYWAAIYVTGDISSEITTGFLTASSLNLTDAVMGYFETGRDYVTVGADIIPTLLLFNNKFRDILQSKYYPQLVDNLTDSSYVQLKNTNVLTSYPDINFEDGAPAPSTVVLGPTQVGLIYMIIMTFFQVMWLQQLHQLVASAVNTRAYLIYRMVIPHAFYLVTAMAFACLNRAFQIPMNNSWSGGFGVLWMIAYVTMAAVGGANENMFLICSCTLPPLIGFWMLFFVIINISGTFSPLALCPEFYRFTYMMPIKCGAELMKVLFYNTTRKAVGRCFGILIAWIVVNNALLPFCLMFFSRTMHKKIKAEQLAKLEKEAKENGKA
ncbi:hypothetical protein DAMA08_009880 [Martiniozyma asiatica (nom. inval.)]|nr:hypothetical protein DAMA08_009880 [Martiniozyma asiatica]